ncbi:MAG: hypothetical protein WCK74_04120, partial [Gemmatimonadaceae bacterium]
DRRPELPADRIIERRAMPRGDGGVIIERRSPRDQGPIVRDGGTPEPRVRPVTPRGDAPTGDAGKGAPPKGEGKGGGETRSARPRTPPPVDMRG